MGKTAIVLGATGLTGGLLLKKLLEDDDYTQIKVISRRSVDNPHSKIEEHLGDITVLDTFSVYFKADVVFCCIGTTKAKTPDKDTYRKIDYGIPVSAAQLALENEIPVFIVISAMGADPNSRIFYNRLKGEMEQDVLSKGITNTYILQPSLIGGNRKERRVGESFAKSIIGIFGFLLPKKYKMILPETIAACMHTLAERGYPESRISSEQIKEIARS